MTNRRIRKLHLNAPDETLGRRAAILIEDAFHTASLPNPGGRLLLVRSLSLGVIRTTQSSAAVARAIEERLRLLSSTAVYAEDPSAPWCLAVYFHNEAEPYVRLATRLARGQNTDAWFWPLAAAPFRRDMPPDEALRSLLFEAAKTEAGGVAMAGAIVRSLLERGVADKLFEALRWLDGQFLLDATGCSMPEVPIALLDAESPEGSLEVEIPVQWLEALDRWTSRWGADDARTVWLAALALIAERPARALDRRLAIRAAQLVMLATRRTASMRPNARRTVTNGAPVSSAKAKQQASTDDISRAAANADRPASAQTFAVPGLPAPEADRPPSTQAVAVRTSPAPDRARLDAASLGNSYVDSSGAGTAIPQPSLIALSDYPEAPRFTRYAGMFFLLPVMSRLGMAALLDCNPLLLECELPSRLLVNVGARLEIAPDDPMMQALKGLCAKNPPALGEFVEPELWKQGICNDGPLLARRVEASPRERVLFDGSGRLALALWRGRCPIAVRQLARDLPVTRGASIERQSGLDLLLDSWLVAMRRWCRRYARVGLRDLVCRSGRVSATSTHVDAVFDHRQADIRVRKAGLDLDPGWIPWFGRVVSFHYQYGEYADG